MCCWQEQREPEDSDVVEAETIEEEKEGSALTLESLLSQTKVATSSVLLDGLLDSPCGG